MARFKGPFAEMVRKIELQDVRVGYSAWVAVAQAGYQLYPVPGPKELVGAYETAEQAEDAALSAAMKKFHVGREDLSTIRHSRFILAFVKKP